MTFRTAMLCALTLATLVGCTAPATSTPAPTTPVAQQATLPFPALTRPSDVAVDATGTVYVTDAGHALQLPADADGPTTLPYERAVVLADVNGGAWVVDEANHVLVKLGSAETRPIPGFGIRGQLLAIADEGNAYGVYGGGIEPGSGACCLPVRVVDVGPGDARTELPFDGVSGFDGLAIDRDGAVYAGDAARKRVMKWMPGGASPITLPFGDLQSLVDVTVDQAGNVYAVDSRAARVLKLAPGADAPEVLPFVGLQRPIEVAAGPDAVYVLDASSNTVVELVV